ncbi:MAG: glycosyltransferase [Desulfarculaceae bacterium]|jgi:spore maturation protein CgeB
MTAKYLEKNLEALARQQPDLAQSLAEASPAQGAGIEPSRTGPPALSINGIRLTSTVDPVDEGRRMAASAPAGPLAGLGFGLGYHLEPLRDRDLVVWESDPGLLRLALESRDLSGLLGRIRLVVDPEDLGDLKGRSPYIHRPSARLRPAEAEGLLRRLEPKTTPQARPSSPRVLIVPPILGGTLNAAYWCAEALSSLGCRVRTLPIEKIAPLYELVRKSPEGEERLDRVRKPMIDFLSELTLLMAEEFQPHLCLVLAQAPLGIKALKEIRKLGVISAFWFAEDYRLMTYFKDVAASYDHFFHIQGEEFEAQLSRLGANYSYLPVAAHPPCHRPLELSAQDRLRYGGRVGFMGAGYPNRVHIFSELVQQGLSLRLWGVDWPLEGPLAACLAEPNRYLPQEEVVKIYNACQIILNLHSVTWEGSGVGQADFVNPRTMEVAACGGFQLVDNVRGLESLLTPGREVALFTSLDDLKDQINHYQRHPDLRARIAAAGRRRVLNEHTYYHRMETVLRRCLGPVQEADRQISAMRPLDPETGLGPEQAAPLMLSRLAPSPSRA